MDGDRRAQLQRLLDGADPFEIAPGYLHQVRAEDFGELLADSVRAEQLEAALAWYADENNSSSAAASSASYCSSSSSSSSSGTHEPGSARA